MLWYVQEIRDAQRQHERELRNANSSNTGGVLSTSAHAGNPAAGLIGHVRPLHGAARDNQNALLGGALTNLIVIIGFAAFAFAVKQILASMVDQ